MKVGDKIRVLRGHFSDGSPFAGCNGGVGTIEEITEQDLEHLKINYHYFFKAL